MVKSATIKRTVDGLALITPYDDLFLRELKRLVPSSERRWRKPAWIVDPKHEASMLILVESRFGKCKVIDGDGPESVGGLVLIEKRKATVEYIGSCKQRESGESSAFGWVAGDWNIIFPERVLREYFKAGPSGLSGPSNQSTLYGLLGVDQSATPEQIKSAYRRAARQWHPDVNKDPDAEQVFLRFKEAYQILNEPRQRKRYDAGLSLEHSGSRDVDSILTILQATYRAPYTCGVVYFKGKRSLGRWVVDEIVSWDDIKNEQGQTMVSSWDKLNNTFQTSWLDADFGVEL